MKRDENRHKSGVRLDKGESLWELAEGGPGALPNTAQLRKQVSIS